MNGIGRFVILSLCTAALPTPFGSAADLRYVTFQEPCRIIDTRLSDRGMVTSAEPQSFKVKGETDFEAQGGSIDGCNVPEQAVAAVINFVAVNPQGGGNLRGSAYPNEIPRTGSIINYQALSPILNIANGLPFPICDLPSGECPSDISLIANGASVHVVADVLGYFLRGVVSSVTTGSGLTGEGDGDVTISIASSGVTSDHVEDNSLGSDDLADDSVGSFELADNSVDGPAVQNGAISEQKISAPLAMFSGRINGLGDVVGFGGATGHTASTSVEGDVTTLSPNRPCVAQNLSVKLTVSPGPGAIRQFALRVNRGFTSVFCMIPEPSTTCQSGAGTAPVPPGSELSIHHVAFFGASVSPSDALFGWECR